MNETGGRRHRLLWLIGGLLGPFARLLLRFANIIMPGKGLKEGPYVTEQEIRAYATNGQLNLLEEYFDVKVNVELPANLFEPDMYRTPPWQETRPPGR